MNVPAVHIRSIGLATPTHSIAQMSAAKFAVNRAGATNGAAGFIERVHRNSGVSRRGSVLLAPTAERPDAIPFFDDAAQDRGPTTVERLAVFEREAGPLAAEAATAALDRAGCPAGAVTHLVTVSCTGMAAPGIDCDLMARLGLSSGVLRTHIGFMGCFGGIVGLRTAAAFAASQPGAVVLLVCVELCSLHFQDTAAPDQTVANALFADGAAAAVLSSGEDAVGPVVASCASTLIPDSDGLMSWRVGEHGFEMRLDASVPNRFGSAAAAWLDSWLAGKELGRADIASWAIHPGGPRVLSEVAGALGLDAGAVGPSAEVLSRHGNMSSATVLFVLERLLGTAGRPPLPCVMLAFGPGLTAEGLLLSGDPGWQQSHRHD